MAFSHIICEMWNMNISVSRQIYSLKVLLNIENLIINLQKSENPPFNVGLLSLGKQTLICFLKTLVLSPPWRK